MAVRNMQKELFVSQSNGFEPKTSSSVLSHLPPLNTKQTADCGYPHILERGSFTEAAPVKERKYFRKVSDSIGNNYSPQARELTTLAIYEATKFDTSVEEKFFLSPRLKKSSGSGIEVRRRSAGHVTSKPISTTNHPNSAKGYEERSSALHPITGSHTAKEETSSYQDQFLPPINNTSSHTSEGLHSRFVDGGKAHLSEISIDGNYDGGGHSSAVSFKSPIQQEVSTQDTAGKTRSPGDNQPETDVDNTRGSAEPQTDESHTEYQPREHDRLTQEILNVKFPPSTFSTHGLSRPGSPTTEHKQRYYKITEDAIDSSMVAPISQQTLEGVYRFDTTDLRPKLKKATECFLQEMDEDYRKAIKKAIVNYLLLDTNEQARLGITVPKETPNSAGREYYPWHQTVDSVHEFMKSSLFLTHPVMCTVLYNFETKCCDFRLIDIPALKKKKVPTATLR